MGPVPDRTNIAPSERALKFLCHIQSHHDIIISLINIIFRENNLKITGIAAASIALSGAVAFSAQAQDDAGHNNDYRTFTAAGIGYGQIADSYSADLVMYLAGNQFMVMEELISDFQSLNTDIASIYVETIHRVRS